MAHCEGSRPGCTNEATHTDMGYAFCLECARQFAGYTPEAIEQTKHTPGPWNVKTYDDGTIDVIGGVEGYHIVHMPFTGYPAAVCANAQLIAAAPDLLAMCECELADYELSYEALIAYHEGRTADINERMRLLRTVITKARMDETQTKDAPLLERLANLLTAARAYRDAWAGCSLPMGPLACGAYWERLAAAIAALDEREGKKE